MGQKKGIKATFKGFVEVILNVKYSVLLRCSTSYPSSYFFSCFLMPEDSSTLKSLREIAQSLPQNYCCTGLLLSYFPKFK